jgi:hypothetical protein
VVSKAKAGKAVLNMALDAIGGVDDVARAAGKAVKAPKAAAAKALDAIADTADDWGWKGGKPGEITGTEYRHALSKFNELAKYGDRDSKQAKALYDTLEKGAMQWYDSALKGKLGTDWKSTAEHYARTWGTPEELWRNAKNRSKFLGGTPGEYTLSWFQDVSRIAPRFEAFEKLGTPRKLTGQLFRSMPRPMLSGSLLPYNTDEVVGAIKSLPSAEMRETFLALLPEWTGTLADLAAAAKALG